MSYFCADISEDTFNCFSDCAGYDYDVKVMDSADLEKAMDIAERELRYYGCPEQSPDESYYFCSGYWEVVSDALIENGIAAKLIADHTEEQYDYDPYAWQCALEKAINSGKPLKFTT